MVVVVVCGDGGDGGGCGGGDGGCGGLTANAPDMTMFISL